MSEPSRAAVEAGTKAFDDFYGGDTAEYLDLGWENAIFQALSAAAQTDPALGFTVDEIKHLLAHRAELAYGPDEWKLIEHSFWDKLQCSLKARKL